MKFLSCEECREELAQLPDAESASSHLDEVANAEVAAHLATCADCSREYSMLCATVAALRSLPPITAPNDLRERIRLQIAQETSQRVASTPVKARWNFAFPRWVSLSVPSAAIAASLLLFVMRQPETAFFAPTVEESKNQILSDSPSSTTTVTRSSSGKEHRIKKPAHSQAKTPPATTKYSTLRKKNSAAPTSTRSPEIAVLQAPEATRDTTAGDTTAGGSKRTVPPTPESLQQSKATENPGAPVFRNSQAARTQVVRPHVEFAQNPQAVTAPREKANAVTDTNRRLFARLETLDKPLKVSPKTLVPPVSAGTMGDSSPAATGTTPQPFSTESNISDSAATSEIEGAANSSIMSSAESIDQNAASADMAVEAPQSGALARANVDGAKDNSARANGARANGAASSTESSYPETRREQRSAASNGSIQQGFSASAPEAIAPANRKMMSGPAAKSAPQGETRSLKLPSKSVYAMPLPKAVTAKAASTRSVNAQPAFATLSLVLPRSSTRARVLLQWPGTAPQVVWLGKAKRGQKLLLPVLLPNTKLLAGNKKRSAQVSVQEARPPIATQTANWTTIARENITLEAR